MSRKIKSTFKAERIPRKYREQYPSVLAFRRYWDGLLTVEIPVEDKSEEEQSRIEIKRRLKKTANAMLNLLEKDSGV